MVLEKLNIHILKKENEIRTLPYTIHKNHSECIKDFNVKPETGKVLELNIGKILLTLIMSTISWI